MNQDALARAKSKGNPLIDGNLITFVWEMESAPLLIGDFNGREGSTPAFQEQVLPNTWTIWPLKKRQDAYR